MKKVLIIVSVIFLNNSITLSQTKSIAHRSHSGNDYSEGFKSNDNFGINLDYQYEMEKRMLQIDSVNFYLRRKNETSNIHLYEIDSVVKLSDTSIIEMSYNRKDTVYLNPYIEHKSIEEIVTLYPKKITLIGFDEKKLKKENKKPKSNNQNGIHWLVGFIVILGITFSSINLKFHGRK